ncbi:hypothetical protein BDV35DRAFT_365306, partial [Aspergillus flavus]
LEWCWCFLVWLLHYLGFLKPFLAFADRFKDGPVQVVYLPESIKKLLLTCSILFLFGSLSLSLSRFYVSTLLCIETGSRD